MHVNLVVIAISLDALTHKEFPLFAASSASQPLKRRDAPPTVQPRSSAAAHESAARFHRHAAAIRTSSTEWKAWAFPLTPEQSAQKAAALQQARVERRLRSRQAASHGVFEFARRIDGWMAKCCRYKEVCAADTPAALIHCLC
jgi:hypothetical protein